MYIDRDYIVNLTARREIIATFKNGREVLYTTDILSLLFSDPNIETVTDVQDGTIVFTIL